MSDTKLIPTEKQFLQPLKEFEKKQNQLIKEHPFIKIEDTETFESAKKSRTALVKGRTELQKQQKTINDSVNTIKSAVKVETERLIEITKPAEELQQTEVKRYESIQEQKRLERERIAEEKMEKIQNMIDDIVIDFEKEIKLLEFECIDIYKSQMEQELDEIDASKFEDLEIYFSGKVSSLKNTLEIKISELKKDQELLVSQSENRFQQFKSKWMERFMDANINNIKQLNIDFDTEVPEIDPDTFFTFKDQFLKESNKFRAKLIDVTNVCKLQQEKADDKTRKETLKSSIKEYFDILEKTVGDTTFETIVIYANEISKSIDEIKVNKDYDEFKDLIELNISNIENLSDKKNKELVEVNKEFEKSEKIRIAKEKNDNKKNDSVEKKRQKELKPFKELAHKMVCGNEVIAFIKNEEVEEIMNEFIERMSNLRTEFINKIQEI